MPTAGEPGRPPLPPTPAVSADCGELEPACGVSLRWPDGELTEVCERMGTSMNTLRMASAAASFDRDLEADFAQIKHLIDTARADGVRLLALPEAALGGYLVDLNGAAEGPPALAADGPEIRRLARLAGDMVVAVGYCEQGGDRLFNSAVCVTGDGILGHHRKVHQPLREDASYGAGDRFTAFDTPVGRLGMMICYDKAFPESARVLALDGASIVLCLSAWPASSTNRTPDLQQDRWKRRFDLFDRARALENQIVWLSANQSGEFGSLRFVSSAKIVDPGGEILADTGVTAGLAVAELDVQQALETPAGPWLTCATADRMPMPDRKRTRSLSPGERETQVRQLFVFGSGNLSEPGPDRGQPQDSACRIDGQGFRPRPSTTVGRGPRFRPGPRPASGSRPCGVIHPLRSGPASTMPAGHRRASSLI
jgi:predicted amidohydrolase